MIAKIELTKLGRNCAIAITEIGTTITQTYVEDSGNIEMNYNQGNNTVTVTIFGTTSATTPIITTGTFLTMDSGTGAVTITSYATFKTNYALLFLNGGSVPTPPTPTLDEVLTAGNTSNNGINLGPSSLQSLLNNNTIFFFNVGTGANDASYSFLNSKELLFKINDTEYQTRLLPNLYELNLNLTNYLPQSSGTLLNGEFVNQQGLFINYASEIYALGNDSTSRGLFMDNNTQSYSLGNDSEGLNININTNLYKLGHANNYFQIDGGSNTTTLKTESIVLDGGGLIGGLGAPTGTSLLITINNNQYKINLAQ